MTIVLALLAIGAFILALVSAAGRCPLWVAVVLLCLIEMLEKLPGGLRL